MGRGTRNNLFSEKKPRGRPRNPPSRDAAPLLVKQPKLIVGNASISASPSRLKVAFGRRADEARGSLTDARIEMLRLRLIDRDERALRRYLKLSRKLERELEGPVRPK